MDTVIRALIFVGFVTSIFATRATEQLEEDFRQLMDDGLGLTRVQSYFSTDITFDTRPFDGPAALEEITSTMEDDYEQKVRLLREDLAREMSEAYTNPAQTNPYMHCCDENAVYPDWDERLGKCVDYDRICVFGKGLEQEPDTFVPPSMVNFWKEKFKDEHSQGVQWIYYGDEDGVLYIYPAARVDQCDKPAYDHRYRPFYIETVTPVPKDIVLVIDTSGSMGDIHNGQTLMDIAIAAGITVIDTLNINDRVGIVAFSDEAHTPPGQDTTSDCYQQQMARATRENKEYLTKEYLSHLSYGGGTYYRTALRAAFGLLKNVPETKDDTRKRSKVILFLTDGQPDDKESPSNASEPGAQFTEAGYIYQDIREMNAELNNSVIILTYGLGSSINEDVKMILTKMAQQIIYDETVEEVTPGLFTPIENPDTLRSAMASYYNLLVKTGVSPDVHFTVPYNDAFGSGMIASMCISVNIGSKLQGVICFDQPIEKVLSELMYRQAGQSSYFFMVDTYSRVLDHPYIPIPSEITDHPIFTFLRTLEIGDDIDDMIFSMINSIDGNITLNTKKFISKGDSIQDGVFSQIKTTQYFWRKVIGTTYVVGVAIAESDKEMLIEWTEELPQEFFYHTQASSRTIEKCSHLSAVAVKDRMAIQFALSAFTNPYQFIFVNETTELINSYRQYFTTSGSENPPIHGFKEQIREYVAATAHFQQIILNSDDIFTRICRSRYLATANGIFRIFPAVELPKHYDPTQRLWYKQAIANPQVLTFTRPYLDAYSESPIVTLSHVIMGAKAEAPSSDHMVLGVMAMDVTLEHVYELVAQSMPICQHNNCFVVDRAGYIITHSDWLCNGSVRETVIDVHINKKEPRIARTLIEQRHMKHAACVNVIEIRNQFTWRITTDGDYSYGNQFEVHEIAGTNVLLVVKKSASPAAACCQYSTYQNCPSTENQGHCFCPCYTPEKENYLFCEDIYNLSSDDYPICSPPLPVLYASSVPKPLADLEPCYDFDCESYETMCACEAAGGCGWCVHRGNHGDACTSCLPSHLCSNNQTSNKQCTSPTTTASVLTSYIDVITTSEVPPDSIDPKDGTPGWAVALSVLFTLACVVFIVVAILIGIRCLVLKKAEDLNVRSDNDNYDMLPDMPIAYDTISHVAAPSISSGYSRQGHINGGYLSPETLGNTPEHGAFTGPHKQPVLHSVTPEPTLDHAVFCTAGEPDAPTLPPSNRNHMNLTSEYMC